MKNSTNIRISKKYEKYIKEVWYEGEDGYWADLTDACICELTESNFVHEMTVAEFQSAIRHTLAVISESRYIGLFGTSCLEDYRADRKRLEELATKSEKEEMFF